MEDDEQVTTDEDDSSSSQAPEPYDPAWDINNLELFPPNHCLSKDDKLAMASQILLMFGLPETELSQQKIDEYISKCSNLSWWLAYATVRHHRNQQRSIQALSVKYKKHMATQWQKNKQKIMHVVDERHQKYLQKLQLMQSMYIINNNSCIFILIYKYIYI